MQPNRTTRFRLGAKLLLALSALAWPLPLTPLAPLAPLAPLSPIQSLHGQQSAQPNAMQPIRLTIYAPASARIEIQGYRTNSIGTVREFVSPPVPIGETFTYTLKMVYVDARGESVVFERNYTVKGGERKVLDLRPEALANDPGQPVAKQPTVPYRPTEPTIKKTPPKEPVLPKLPPVPFEPIIKDPLPKDPLPKDPLPKDPLPKQPSEPIVKEPTPKKPLDPKDDEPIIHVPFVPTPPSVVEAMLKLAKVGPDDVVADLGCGDGRIIVSAVKDFKAKKGLGIDIVPERIEDTLARAKNAEVADKIVTKQADVLRLTPKDLEGVTVVTLYMLPEVNEKLAPLLKQALPPGARIVSHRFEIKGWPADQTIQVRDEVGLSIDVHLWIIRDPQKKSE